MTFEEIKAIDYTSSPRYYDFTNGVHIKDFEVQDWINKAIDRAKEKFIQTPSIETSHADCHSGNTKVTVDIYRQSNGQFTVSVVVATSFKSFTECNVE